MEALWRFWSVLCSSKSSTRYVQHQ